jgi:hypothetical protein
MNLFGDMMDVEENAPTKKEQAKKQAKAPINPQLMRDLIRTQAANGSFPLNGLQKVVPGATAGALQSSVPPNVKYSAEIEALIVTAIACEYFARVFSDQQTSWSLVVKKAKAWIKKQADALSLSLDWDQLAKSFLDKMGVH